MPRPFDTTCVTLASASSHTLPPIRITARPNIPARFFGTLTKYARTPVIKDPASMATPRVQVLVSVERDTGEFRPFHQFPVRLRRTVVRITDGAREHGGVSPQSPVFISLGVLASSFTDGGASRSPPRPRRRSRRSSSEISARSDFGALNPSSPFRRRRLDRSRLRPRRPSSSSTPSRRAWRSNKPITTASASRSSLSPITTASPFLERLFRVRIRIRRAGTPPLYPRRSIPPSSRRRRPPRRTNLAPTSSRSVRSSDTPPRPLIPSPYRSESVPALQSSVPSRSRLLLVALSLAPPSLPLPASAAAASRSSTRARSTAPPPRVARAPSPPTRPSRASLPARRSFALSFDSFGVRARPRVAPRPCPPLRPRRTSRARSPRRSRTFPRSAAPRASVVDVRRRAVSSARSIDVDIDRRFTRRLVDAHCARGRVVSHASSRLSSHAKTRERQGAIDIDLHDDDSNSLVLETLATDDGRRRRRRRAGGPGSRGDPRAVRRRRAWRCGDDTARDRRSRRRRRDRRAGRALRG